MCCIRSIPVVSLMVFAALEGARAASYDDVANGNYDATATWGSSSTPGSAPLVPDSVTVDRYVVTAIAGKAVGDTVTVTTNGTYQGTFAANNTIDAWKDALIRVIGGKLTTGALSSSKRNLGGTIHSSATSVFEGNVGTAENLGSQHAGLAFAGPGKLTLANAKNHGASTPRPWNLFFSLLRTEESASLFLKQGTGQTSTTDVSVKMQADSVVLTAGKTLTLLDNQPNRYCSVKLTGPTSVRFPTGARLWTAEQFAFTAVTNQNSANLTYDASTIAFNGRGIWQVAANSGQATVLVPVATPAVDAELDPDETADFTAPYLSSGIARLNYADSSAEQTLVLDLVNFADLGAVAALLDANPAFTTVDANSQLGRITVTFTPAGSNETYFTWQDLGGDVKSIHLGEPGEEAWLGFSGMSVGGVTHDSATVSARVDAAGLGSDALYVCYDTSDHGMVLQDWPSRSAVPGGPWSPGDAFSRTIGGLAPDQVCAFRLIGSNFTENVEGWSLTNGVFTTAFAPSLTVAPISPTRFGIGTRSLSVGWIPAFTNCSGYVLQWWLTISPAVTNEVLLANKSVITHKVTNLEPLTEVNFRVAAIHSASGSRSSWATAVFTTAGASVDLITAYGFDDAANGFYTLSTGSDGMLAGMHNRAGALADRRGPGLMQSLGRREDRSFDNTESTGTADATGGVLMQVATNAALNEMMSFTLSGWCLKQTTGASVFSRYFTTSTTTDHGAGGDGFDLYENNVRQRQFSVGYNSVTSSDPANDADASKWTFFALTYDGTKSVNNVTFYKGYRSREEAPAGDPAVRQVSAHTVPVGRARPTPKALHMGNSVLSGARCFDGWLDNLRIHGTQVTDDGSGALSLEALEALRLADTRLPPRGTVILIN